MCFSRHHPTTNSSNKTKRFSKDCEKIIEKLLVDVYLTCMKYEWSCWGVSLSAFSESCRILFYSSLQLNFAGKIYKKKNVDTKVVTFNIIHWNEFTFLLLFMENCNSFSNYYTEDWFSKHFVYRFCHVNQRRCAKLDDIKLFLDKLK